MTKLAAIEGQLVSIKNVSTHKSACLTIHVPEEYALKVIEAFGWPTMVAPVHVAIARMGEPEKAAPAEVPKERRKWDELSIAQQAGIMCGEKGFQRYISEALNKRPDEVDTDAAATYVRTLCGVNSRAHIEGNETAERKFRALRISYDNWLRVPA
jgi:hypothetical protein